VVELDGEECHVELTQVSKTVVENMQTPGERTNHSSDGSPYQKKCDETWTGLQLLALSAS